ncbi:MAG: phage tail assembly protein [Blastomonas fulva]|uniref:phage tail assembly protein n=1 Tax=Blastomonas fulva TaxID=1550728 RepID=UPI004033CC7D
MDRYTLRYPVTLSFRQTSGEVREETISEITLRRPTAKEMRLVDRAGSGMVGLVISMLAILSGHDEDTIERIDAQDFAELADMVTDFLPSGRTAGKTG